MNNNFHFPVYPINFSPIFSFLLFLFWTPQTPEKYIIFILMDAKHSSATTLLHPPKQQQQKKAEVIGFSNYT